MTQDYNNPIDQMKAISWNLKRIADALEDIESKMPTPEDKLRAYCGNDIPSVDELL